ncbi:class I SAM-dependent methyltransferase [Solimicrobium silvestre]|uniref:Putative methyltransferase n=1 Tax=Solimicrobium silvestre TaxID=2099400 RepID=A0A2S9GZ05_9BURK|nr:class I SAM-dependent methyltransferase [Solimicrobium silvestre]PRC92964.1 putative methyltransferase [Solimicrobium silvestre]
MAKTHLLRQFNKTPPAIVALLIQIASLSFIALVLTVLWQVFKVKLSLPVTLLFHAALTLLLTRCFNLAWWWCVMQPLLPLAIVAMLALALPPFLYFLIFSFLLFFYWSTFRTQVPYFPSTPKVWATVEKLLPQKRPISFVDIGSGLGGLVLYLAKRNPESQFAGVEIAPLPWLLSYLRTLGKRKSPQFLRANYEALNFSDFDVIFAYLSPAAMPGLWAKAKQEMQAGSLLISYEFPIVGVDADQIICPENSRINGVKVYLWIL